MVQKCWRQEGEEGDIFSPESETDKSTMSLEGL
jgi:hypothetical protein